MASKKLQASPMPGVSLEKVRELDLKKPNFIRDHILMHTCSETVTKIDPVNPSLTMNLGWVSNNCLGYRFRIIVIFESDIQGYFL